ncbi:archease [Methylocystis echinoides]|jgi:tRNA nucleotidyltransferase (CCA-adding enzyme)|uniref:archease n=1 Tax=Methylocystis echinoides TaxID=29468 RepID=UPI003439B7F2
MSDPPAIPSPPAPSKRWEHFPHDADLGIRGFGATPAQAFEQGALALVAAITDPALVRGAETVEIEREAPSLDLLFLDWLNALIFEMAERRMIFGTFDIKIGKGRLTARAHGEAVSRDRHAPAVEPKGATFTELAVAEDSPGQWRAQCVVDV